MKILRVYENSSLSEEVVEKLENYFLEASDAGGEVVVTTERAYNNIRYVVSIYFTKIKDYDFEEDDQKEALQDFKENLSVLNVIYPIINRLSQKVNFDGFSLGEDGENKDNVSFYVSIKNDESIKNL
jgi:hypothetical protein